MKEIFQLGDFAFSLTTPDELKLPENMMKFKIPKEDLKSAGHEKKNKDSAENEPIYAYQIFITDHFPKAEGKRIVQRNDLLVFRDETGKEQRLIGIKGEPEPYAYYREVSDGAAEIYLKSAYVSWLPVYDVVFSSLLCLERRLAKASCLILHCAYIETNGSALLFSAPSGTGKSTQAGLWEQWKQARTINGDKALMQRETSLDGKRGTWQAKGWPVCGTSGICYNETFPIRSVVVLEQARENKAERLKAAEAFTALYGQITVNRWDRTELLHSVELLEQLVEEVPVFRLSCDISREAVETLAEELEMLP